MTWLNLSSIWQAINLIGRMRECEQQRGVQEVEIAKMKLVVDALKADLESMRKLQQIGTIVCDAKGVIGKAGVFMVDMAGYTGDELIGRSIKELIPYKYRRDHDVAFAEVASDRRELRDSPYEVELLRKDGTQIQVLVNLTILPGEPRQFRADIRRRW